MPLKNYTLTYRNPVLAGAGFWIENFLDKYGRLARADGPFNFLTIRNPTAANLTFRLNQDPNATIILLAGDSYADKVQPYTSLRIDSDAAIAADQVIIIPKRVDDGGNVALSG